MDCRSMTPPAGIRFSSSPRVRGSCGSRSWIPVARPTVCSCACSRAQVLLTIDGQRQPATFGLSLEAVVDFATASHARALAVLLVVSLLGFLPGFFSIPPIDRDEARFAQATKQMIENGDYIDLRFQDDVRYKKPVGIYWLQAAVVKSASALGMRNALTTIWLYRTPSLIGAVGAVLLTYWAALALVSRRAAFLAGLMMGTCVLLGVERLMAKTDAMLLMTVVAAMGAMARAYLWREPNR